MSEPNSYYSIFLVQGLPTVALRKLGSKKVAMWHDRVEDLPGLHLNFRQSQVKTVGYFVLSESLRDQEQFLDDNILFGLP